MPASRPSGSLSSRNAAISAASSMIAKGAEQAQVDAILERMGYGPGSTKGMTAVQLEKHIANPDPPPKTPALGAIEEVDLSGITVKQLTEWLSNNAN